MTTLLYVLLAILVLAIMIFIHELGHYTAGRLLGFKILDFSIGFGPAILKFKKNDITYALRAIPLGGSCRFYGEDDEPMDAVSFNAQKVWKRIIVVFAGPIMNLLFAFVVSVIMILGYGIDRAIPVISDFTSESARAQVCGVMVGDEIIRVDGTDVVADEIDMVDSLELCTQLIRSASPEGLTLTLKRGGELVDVYVSDIFNEEEQRNILGVYMGADYETVRCGFFESLAASFRSLKNTVVLTAKAIAGWFTHGIGKNEVSGVVGTVAITAQVASYGFKYVLKITALISLSLGLFNLLPIPALDGGRLLFLFIELIVGKPIPREIEANIHLAGMLLLFGLMALVTVFDVIGLFNGSLILK